MPKKRLNTFERDILNEVGSMCAGNATTALAQILDRRIDLHFPKIEFVTAEKLPWYISKHPEEIVIGVHMHILGGMRGNALLVFPKKYAFDIIDILIGPFENKNDAPTEIGISALKEMGNVVISAYLSSLTAFTGISAFSSTVNLTSGAAKYLVNLAFAGLGREDRVETVLIEAIFKE
ncbi:MAG: chemotaxis protein CheC, partial [Candidatus Omnitrophica bacterium]|nr:chemotaxis protein CheC [Candidatus Omnitrophota bacterium]